MTEADRRFVRQRAQHCCEYCLSQALLSHDDFAVEHIQPRALEGTDDLSNLALSCQAAIAGNLPRSKARILLRELWLHYTIRARIAGKITLSGALIMRRSKGSHRSVELLSHGLI